MTYVKNGGYIRLITEGQLARFAEMGFVPMWPQAVAEANKPARAVKKEKPHGGA